MRDHLRLRMRRHLARQFPQAVHVIDVHALVERLAKCICFRSHFRLSHGVLRNCQLMIRTLTNHFQGSRRSVPMSTDEALYYAITAVAFISNSNSGRARATTCTMVLVGKLDPRTSRRVSLMSR